MFYLPLFRGSVFDSVAFFSSGPVHLMLFISLCNLVAPTSKAFPLMLDRIIEHLFRHSTKILKIKNENMELFVELVTSLVNLGVTDSSWMKAVWRIWRAQNRHWDESRMKVFPRKFLFKSRKNVLLWFSTILLGDLL